MKKLVLLLGVLVLLYSSQIVLLTLKFVGVLSWSWRLILLPTEIVGFIVAVVLIFLGLLGRAGKDWR